MRRAVCRLVTATSVAACVVSGWSSEQLHGRSCQFAIWLQTAGTGLFVVYNDTESLEGIGPINGAFIVKYVQQFDLHR